MGELSKNIMRCGLVRLVTKQTPYNIRLRRKGLSNVKLTEDSALGGIAESKMIGRSCAHRMCRIVEKSIKVPKRITSSNKFGLKSPFWNSMDQYITKPVIPKDVQLQRSKTRMLSSLNPINRNVPVSILTNSEPTLKRSYIRDQRFLDKFKSASLYSVYSKCKDIPVRRKSVLKAPHRKHFQYADGENIHRNLYRSKEVTLLKTLNCTMTPLSSLKITDNDKSSFLLDENKCVQESSLLSKCGCNTCHNKPKECKTSQIKLKKLIRSKISNILSFCKLQFYSYNNKSKTEQNVNCNESNKKENNLNPVSKDAIYENKCSKLNKQQDIAYKWNQTNANILIPLNNEGIGFRANNEEQILGSKPDEYCKWCGEHECLFSSDNFDDGNHYDGICKNDSFLEENNTLLNSKILNNCNKNEIITKNVNGLMETFTSNDECQKVPLNNRIKKEKIEHSSINDLDTSEDNCKAFKQTDLFWKDKIQNDEKRNTIETVDYKGDTQVCKNKLEFDYQHLMDCENICGDHNYINARNNRQKKLKIDRNPSFVVNRMKALDEPLGKLSNKKFMKDTSLMNSNKYISSRVGRNRYRYTVLNDKLYRNVTKEKTKKEKSDVSKFMNIKSLDKAKIHDFKYSDFCNSKSDDEVVDDIALQCKNHLLNTKLTKNNENANKRDEEENESGARGTKECQHFMNELLSKKQSESKFMDENTKIKKRRKRKEKVQDNLDDIYRKYVSKNRKKYADKYILLTKGPNFSYLPDEKWLMLNQQDHLLSETFNIRNPMATANEPIKIHLDDSKNLSKYSEINLAINKVRRKLVDIINDSDKHFNSGATVINNIINRSINEGRKYDIIQKRNFTTSNDSTCHVRCAVAGPSSINLNDVIKDNQNKTIKEKSMKTNFSNMPNQKSQIVSSQVNKKCLKVRSSNCDFIAKNAVNTEEELDKLSHMYYSTAQKLGKDDWNQNKNSSQDTNRNFTEQRNSLLQYMGSKKKDEKLQFRYISKDKINQEFIPNSINSTADRQKLKKTEESIYYNPTEYIGKRSIRSIWDSTVWKKGLSQEKNKTERNFISSGNNNENKKMFSEEFESSHKTETKVNCNRQKLSSNSNEESFDVIKREPDDDLGKTKRIHVGNLGMNSYSSNQQYDKNKKREEMYTKTESYTNKKIKNYIHASEDGINNPERVNTSMSKDPDLREPLRLKTRPLGATRVMSPFSMTNLFLIDKGGMGIRSVSTSSSFYNQDSKNEINDQNNLKANVSNKLKNMEKVLTADYQREEKSLLRNETLKKIKVKETYGSSGDKSITSDVTNLNNADICSKEVIKTMKNKNVAENHVDEQIMEEINVTGQFPECKKSVHGKLISVWGKPRSKFTALRSFEEEENIIKNREKEPLIYEVHYATIDHNGEGVDKPSQEVENYTSADAISLKDDNLNNTQQSQFMPTEENLINRETTDNEKEMLRNFWKLYKDKKSAIDKYYHAELKNLNMVRSRDSKPTCDNEESSSLNHSINELSIENKLIIEFFKQYRSIENVYKNNINPDNFTLEASSMKMTVERGTITDPSELSIEYLSDIVENELNELVRPLLDDLKGIDNVEDLNTVIQQYNLDFKPNVFFTKMKDGKVLEPKKIEDVDKDFNLVQMKSKDETYKGLFKDDLEEDSIQGLNKSEEMYSESSYLNESPDLRQIIRESIEKIYIKENTLLDNDYYESNKTLPSNELMKKATQSESINRVAGNETEPGEDKNPDDVIIFKPFKITKDDLKQVIRECIEQIYLKIFNSIVNSRSKDTSQENDKLSENIDEILTSSVIVGINENNNETKQNESKVVLNEPEPNQTFKDLLQTVDTKTKDIEIKENIKSLTQTNIVKDEYERRSDGLETNNDNTNKDYPNATYFENETCKKYASDTNKEDITPLKKSNKEFISESTYKKYVDTELPENETYPDLTEVVTKPIEKINSMNTDEAKIAGKYQLIIHESNPFQSESHEDDIYEKIMDESYVFTSGVEQNIADLSNTFMENIMNIYKEKYDLKLTKVPEETSTFGVQTGGIDKSGISLEKETKIDKEKGIKDKVQDSDNKNTSQPVTLIETINFQDEKERKESSVTELFSHQVKSKELMTGQNGNLDQTVLQEYSKNNKKERIPLMSDQTIESLNYYHIKEKLLKRTNDPSFTRAVEMTEALVRSFGYEKRNASETDKNAANDPNNKDGATDTFINEESELPLPHLEKNNDPITNENLEILQTIAEFNDDSPLNDYRYTSEDSNNTYKHLNTSTFDSDGIFLALTEMTEAMVRTLGATNQIPEMSQTNVKQRLKSPENDPEIFTNREVTKIFHSPIPGLLLDNLTEVVLPVTTKQKTNQSQGKKEDGIEIINNEELFALENWVSPQIAAKQQITLNEEDIKQYLYHHNSDIKKRVRSSVLAAVESTEAFVRLINQEYSSSNIKKSLEENQMQGIQEMSQVPIHEKMFMKDTEFRNSDSNIFLQESTDAILRTLEFKNQATNNVKDSNNDEDGTKMLDTNRYQHLDYLSQDADSKAQIKHVMLRSYQVLMKDLIEDSDFTIDTPITMADSKDSPSETRVIDKRLEIEKEKTAEIVALAEPKRHENKPKMEIPKEAVIDAISVSKKTETTIKGLGQEQQQEVSKEVENEKSAKMTANDTEIHSSPKYDRLGETESIKKIMESIIDGLTRNTTLGVKNNFICEKNAGSSKRPYNKDLALHELTGEAVVSTSGPESAFLQSMPKSDEPIKNFEVNNSDESAEIYMPAGLKEEEISLKAINVELDEITDAIEEEFEEITKLCDHNASLMFSIENKLPLKNMAEENHLKSINISGTIQQNQLNTPEMFQETNKEKLRSLSITSEEINDEIINISNSVIKNERNRQFPLNSVEATLNLSSGKSSALDKIPYNSITDKLSHQIESSAVNEDAKVSKYATKNQNIYQDNLQNQEDMKMIWDSSQSIQINSLEEEVTEKDSQTESWMSPLDVITEQEPLLAIGDISAPEVTNIVFAGIETSEFYHESYKVNEIKLRLKVWESPQNKATISGGNEIDQNIKNQLKGEDFENKKVIEAAPKILKKQAEIISKNMKSRLPVRDKKIQDKKVAVCPMVEMFGSKDFDNKIKFQQLSTEDNMKCLNESCDSKVRNEQKTYLQSNRSEKVNKENLRERNEKLNEGLFLNNKKSLAGERKEAVADDVDKNAPLIINKTPTSNKLIDEWISPIDYFMEVKAQELNDLENRIEVPATNHLTKEKDLEMTCDLFKESTEIVLKERVVPLKAQKIKQQNSEQIHQNFGEKYQSSQEIIETTDAMIKTLGIKSSKTEFPVSQIISNEKHEFTEKFERVNNHEENLSLKGNATKKTNEEEGTRIKTEDKIRTITVSEQLNLKTNEHRNSTSALENPEITSSDKSLGISSEKIVSSQLKISKLTANDQVKQEIYTPVKSKTLHSNLEKNVQSNNKTKEVEQFNVGVSSDVIKSSMTKKDLALNKSHLVKDCRSENVEPIKDQPVLNMQSIKVVLEQGPQEVKVAYNEDNLNSLKATKLKTQEPQKTINITQPSNIIGYGSKHEMLQTHDKTKTQENETKRTSFNEMQDKSKMEKPRIFTCTEIVKPRILIDTAVSKIDNKENKPKNDTLSLKTSQEPVKPVIPQINMLDENTPRSKSIGPKMTEEVNVSDRDFGYSQSNSDNVLLTKNVNKNKLSKNLLSKTIDEGRFSAAVEPVTPKASSTIVNLDESKMKYTVLNKDKNASKIPEGQRQMINDVREENVGTTNKIADEIIPNDDYTKAYACSEKNQNNLKKYEAENINICREELYPRVFTGIKPKNIKAPPKISVKADDVRHDKHNTEEVIKHSQPPPRIDQKIKLKEKPFSQEIPKKELSKQIWPTLKMPPLHQQNRRLESIILEKKEKGQTKSSQNTDFVIKKIYNKFKNYEENDLKFHYIKLKSSGTKVRRKSDVSRPKWVIDASGNRKIKETNKAEPIQVSTQSFSAREGKSIKNTKLESAKEKQKKGSVTKPRWRI